MESVYIIECKELLNNYDKLSRLVRAFEICCQSKKQMGYCRKIIKEEMKIFRETKSVLSAENYQEIDYCHADLYNIVTALMKNDVFIIGKATKDLEEITNKIMGRKEQLTKEIAEYKETHQEEISAEFSELLSEAVQQ